MGEPINLLIDFKLNVDGSLTVFPAQPDCAVCGKPYRQHNFGHGVPMCPIYPTYRPKP